MFNIEESNKIKKIEIKDINKLRKIEYLLLSYSFLLTLVDKLDKDHISNTIFNNSIVQDDVNIQREQIEYLIRVDSYGKTRTYDKNIVKIYEKGIVMLENKIIPLDKLYITHNTNNKDTGFHLRCFDSDDTDILSGSKEKHSYNNITIFKDTTAFIMMLESDSVNINNNCIIIKDKLGLKRIIDNWDGMIHDKVKETDAVEYKYRLGE